jgi:hypothetical protein
LLNKKEQEWETETRNKGRKGRNLEGNTTKSAAARVIKIGKYRGKKIGRIDSKRRTSRLRRSEGPARKNIQYR